MSHRREDLRARFGREAAPRRERGPEAPDLEGPAAPGRRAPDDYGHCPSCGGAREIAMKPMGRDAARMGLVCSGCGVTTGI